MTSEHNTDLQLVLVGCGAVAEHYYAPALAALGESDNLRVSALVDPNPARRTRLSQLLPGATEYTEISQIPPASFDLAIVASTPRFHADQAIALLEGGAHVLCEKPLATDLAEAERMIAAARAADRILTAGYFRRFFATSEYVGDLLRHRPLGAPLSFSWSEGGAFNWPAATPSFFQRSHSAGGVLADSGSHVLDLLVNWFGSPEALSYEDDAMGGLEANARVSLQFPNGVSGTVRLSREAPIRNEVTLQFERGTVTFPGSSACQLSLHLKGFAASLDGALRSYTDLPARSYQLAFMAQISDFARAARGGPPPRVPAADVLPGMRLVSRCYETRRLMSQPWFSPEEIAAAPHYASPATA